MTVDYYARSGQRWATGAALVYGPIAEQLVELFPGRLEGRTVLDAGAGTGVASAPLERRGARMIAIDLSRDMLSWNASQRPPAVVADICALPLKDAVVDDSVAAFVLNHLLDPAPGFAELVRVTRPGGVVLVCVYSTANISDARDRVDEFAKEQGWRVPEWYVEMKASAVPLLGSASGMATAAGAAGLVDVDVDERAVDVGITTPEQLVEYRFGQAHFASWMEELGPERADRIRQRAAEAVRPIMGPYRPIVVFLRAHVRGV